MTEVMHRTGDEISLFSIAATVVRHRWRVVRWMIVGATIAALSVASRPTLYVSTASFIPKGAEVSRSGLSSLAGQFGISVPASSSSLNPDFYGELLKSRAVLDQLVADTLLDPERAGQRITLGRLFGLDDRTRAGRERILERLDGMVTVSVDKITGVVNLSVASQWPNVSAVIASALISAVNDFNARLSQGQAAAERRFLEIRMRAAGDDLRGSEDRLERFLRENRQYTGSPDLVFAHDRLQRDVDLQQQVFSSLMQSYQDARIRELREMPVATIIDSPMVPTRPAPRGRASRLAIGTLLGAFVGIVLVLITEAVRRGRRAGDPEIEDFLGTLRELRLGRLGGLRRLGSRTQG